MENTNFIPANELPVAEGDEVSVLCVENGELKQKAASGLGGGGYDAIISMTYAEDETTVLELVSGSYDAIRAKVLAGDVPNIKVIRTSGNWHGLASVAFVEVCEDTDEDDVVWLVLLYSGEQLLVGVNPDNTMFVD